MHESVFFVGGGVPRVNIPWGEGPRDPPPLASFPPITTQISAGSPSSPPAFPLVVPGSVFTVTGSETGNLADVPTDAAAEVAAAVAGTKAEAGPPVGAPPPTAAACPVAELAAF